MTDDPNFEVTVELTRGTSTDDRDKMRVKVSANSIDALNEKVQQVKEQMEDWAADLREVQPGSNRGVTDDQATLEEARS